MSYKLKKIASSADEALRFVGWRMNNYADFRERTTSPFYFTPLKDANDAERWIRLSLGEFVYFFVPELCPRRLEMQTLAGVDNGGAWTVGCWMRNVQCPPPGYVPRPSFWDRGFFGWHYIRANN